MYLWGRNDVSLFLTYHKILPDAPSPGSAEFYSVTRADLLAQLRSVQAAGYRPLDWQRLGQPGEDFSRTFALSFDDGTADHLQVVLPVLEELGLTAVFFVPTAKLNRPGYLTSDQVQALARAGQHIGLHGHEHRRMDLFSDDELREQMGRSHAIITELLKAPPRFFAPPGGFINEHVREVALGFGVQAIRTMRWGYNRPLDRTHLEVIPMNRHTTAAKFQRILSGRQTRHLYYLKEGLKACVPSRAYEHLRASLFKFAGRN